jgi:hypothetical protein
MSVHCKKDTSLSKDEKEVFSDYLQQQGLSGNIWDLFGEWVAKSTTTTNFFYLKVYNGDELLGIGLFLKIKPVDLRTSYGGLRKNVISNKLAGGISALTNNCVYVSFRNLITSNISRPFFFVDQSKESLVMDAILTWLKNEKEADMVTLVDTATNDSLYQNAGFKKYSSPSEAYLDVTKYSDLSEYLNEHRSLKKNLRRKRNIITTEILHSPLSEKDIEQMRECVTCSVGHSRVSNPCQKFFEDNIFETDVFNSENYIHILIRVENTIVGFHTFLVCGSHLGGVLGGFNREKSRGTFAYERVIVASLDYAIKNQLRRVHYSLIDNYTKLRLVKSTDPCGLYFYSGSPVNRAVFNLTYRYNDIFQLSLLETVS